MAEPLGKPLPTRLMPSIRSPSCSMTDTRAQPHHRSSVSPSTSLDRSGNRAQKCRTVNTQQPRNEVGQEVVNASQHLPPFPQPPHPTLDGSGLLGFCASAPVMSCTAVFLTNSDPLWQTPACICCHWVPLSILFFPLVFHHSPLSHQAFSVNGQTVNVSASTGHMVSNTMTQLHPCSLKAGGHAIC